MHRNLIALALLIAAAGPAAASDESEIMIPLHQFLDGFSKDEVKSALEACAEETSIIDDFPPYEWHGAGACARWAKDAEADSKRNGTSDVVFVLGKLRHLAIKAGRAYVIVPVTETYLRKGKLIAEPVHLWTVTLKKDSSGWRLIGWAWTTP